MPRQPTYPGVYVEEIPSGVRTITGVATSITAFIGRAVRGETNEPVTINNFGEFERLFGGLDSRYPMSYAVRDFYLNAGGGTQAIIVRLFASPSGRAADEVATAAEDATGQAGATPQIVAQAARAKADESDEEPEKGAADEVATAAEDAAGQAGATPQIVAQAARAKADEVAQARNGKATLTLEKDFRLEAASQGRWGEKLKAKVDQEGIDDDVADRYGLEAKELFNLTIREDIPGGAEERIRNVSVIDGPRRVDRVLAQESQLVRVPYKEDGNPDLPDKPPDNTTGGTPSDNGDGSGSATAGGGAAGGGAGDGGAGDGGAGDGGAGDGGAGDSGAGDGGAGDGGAGDGGAGDGGAGDGGAAGGGADGAPGDGDGGVALLSSSELLSPSALAVAKEAELFSDAFKDGENSASLESKDYTGGTGDMTGLFALERADLFNLLCIPPDARDGDTPKGVYQAAMSYCAERRAMLIVDPPRGWGANEATAASTARDGLDVDVGLTGLPARNAVLYFPRVLQSDPEREGQIDVFAPSGIVAGVMANTDVRRGVWKAPAGIDAALAGVQGLQVNLTDDQNGMLNPLGINCLRTFPIIGSVVWGARTLRGADQLADEYKYVSVRRLALYIEESLYRGLKWVVFEQNYEPLWAQIRLNVGAFMHNLFRQGAFQGQTPQAAYRVKCDKETTTQNDINLGIVNIVVGFAPLKPAEFVFLKIQQMAGEIAA